MQQKKNKGIASSGDRLPTKQAPKKQILNKKAEEYLREGGNIEDLPTPAEMERAERKMKRNKK
jgi:hypothetical protein